MRDLQNFNEALLAKSLWKVASESKAQWVSLVIAKYIPRFFLWQSKRKYNCIIFWRSIMNLRTKLSPLVSRNLGNGANCMAFGQSWFQGATLHVPTTNEHRSIRVSDLVVHEMGTWDMQQLVNLFGYEACVTIISTIKVPTVEDREDEAMFALQPNGNFSVKKMYNHLAGNLEVTNRTRVKLWRDVWNKGKVLPRIKLFVWKLMHNALPLGNILASRGIRTDEVCVVCGVEQEDLNHMLFLCPFARRCWFGSPLPIRSHTFNQSFEETLRCISQTATKEQWEQFCAIAWALWRVRNDITYGAKDPTEDQFRKYLAAVSTETLIFASSSLENSAQILEQQHEEFELTCHVDGSYENEWLGGVGYVINKGSKLLCYHSSRAHVSGSLHGEATVLWWAIQEVKRMGKAECMFYTDCEILAKAVTNLSPPVDVEWRAYTEIFECWKALKENRKYACSHISRGHNELADYLAKKGRNEG